jgi:hypothetical protein
VQAARARIREYRKRDSVNATAGLPDSAAAGCRRIVRIGNKNALP